MTIAGSTQLTQDDAYEIAVQICNLANSYVSGMDIQKECRARTNVLDMLLDGQPATPESPRRERGFVQKFLVMFNRPYGILSEDHMINTQ